MKNEVNDRMIYREVVVRNGAETVAAIQAINDGSFDLWIVGRQYGINPMLKKSMTKGRKRRCRPGIWCFFFFLSFFKEEIFPRWFTFGKKTETVSLIL